MNYQFKWSVLWTGESGQWLLSGLITTLELSAVRVAARGRARHPLRRAPHGALLAPARGRDLLRGVLPERPAAGLDVLLVLRGAAAAARRPSRSGSSPTGSSSGPRCSPSASTAARASPRCCAPASSPSRARSSRPRWPPGSPPPGLPLRDPAGGAPAHHSARHQRVAEPAQELVGRAHHQRGRAHVPDAPDRDLHRQGHRGAHRGHRSSTWSSASRSPRSCPGWSGAPPSPASSWAGGSGASHARLSTSSGGTSRS